MLFKKMLRTIKLYKAQFISMIIMIAMGVGVFIGFNIEWYSIEKNTNKFYDETNFADYRIITKDVIQNDEFEKIKNIEGVDDVAKYLSINATVKGIDKVIALTVTSNFNVSSFKLIGEGKEYDENATEGIWLSDSYAKHNNLKVGDTIELTYQLFTVKEKIVGLIKASEYLICVPDESQLMPDYNTFGFAYISPATLKHHLGFETYTRINIKSKLGTKDITNKIEEVLNKTVIVLSKNEVVSYAQTQGEVEEGQIMASILPVLFLIIAILTMITTMHRLVINEKTQIGILKALGFKDKKIVGHYTSLSTFVGAIGIVIGIGIGFLIAYYIMNPDGSMGTYMDMPYWHLYMPWFGWIIVVLILGLLTSIGYLSIKGMLKGTASDALRPYAPKKMKPLLIEKGKLWKKLSFGAKWNLRDIMRHKARSLMSLFGVFGCTILIIASLGMRDTMSDFVNIFYDEAINYKVRISTSDKCTNENAITLSEQYQGDYASIASVKIEEKTVALEIYNIKYDLVKFLDDKEKTIKLEDGGVYICNRIAKEFGYKVGDNIEFSLFDTNESYKVKIIGIIRSLSKSIVLTTNTAIDINCDFKINTIYSVNENIENSDLINNVQTKNNIIKSFDTYMDIMNAMVILFIIAALVLGAVVLYNLGVMSYMERYREMSTLKVVGFKDQKIGILLISQNLWITFVGLILGVPIGVNFLKFMIFKMASEYEMVTHVYLLTYILTIVLIIELSFVVSLLIAKKNKKINMVESLKGIE